MLVVVAVVVVVVVVDVTRVVVVVVVVEIVDIVVIVAHSRVPVSLGGVSEKTFLFSGPETGERKRVTRKADAFADAFGEFRGVLARKAYAFGCPFQLTHFSIPISGPLTFLRKPLPCSPAAETAPQPPIWCSESP